MRDALTGRGVIRRRARCAEAPATSSVVVGPWPDATPTWDPTPHRDHWVTAHAGFRWLTRGRGHTLTEQAYRADSELQARVLRDLEPLLQRPREVRPCIGDSGLYLLLDLGPAWALVWHDVVRTVLTPAMAARHLCRHRRDGWVDL